MSYFSITIFSFLISCSSEETAEDTPTLNSDAPLPVSSAKKLKAIITLQYSLKTISGHLWEASIEECLFGTIDMKTFLLKTHALEDEACHPDCKEDELGKFALPAPENKDDVIKLKVEFALSPDGDLNSGFEDHDGQRWKILKAEKL